MPVAFDAVTTASTNTSFSFTHTPVGTPTAVLVAMTQSGVRLPGVAYGGTVMNRLADVTSPDASTTQYLFGLANPPAGAQTVASSWIGATATGIAAMTLTGSSTTGRTPFGNPATARANSGNASVVLVIGNSGSLAVASVGNQNSVNPSAVAWSGVSPGTERWNFLSTNLFVDVAGQTSTSTGSTTFSWINNNTTNVGDTPSWGLIAIEISAAPANVSGLVPWGCGR